MNKRQFLQSCASVAAFPWLTPPAHSQTRRKLSIIVPFAPKGVSSLLAESLCKQLPIQDFSACEVEHIPGMTNMVATRKLLKRAHEADSTVMIAGPSVFTVGQHLNPFMSVNPAEDLVMLAPLMKGAMVVITSARSGLDTWEKLAAAPGPKKCGVTGLGSPSHVVAAYIDSSLFSLGSAYMADGDLPAIERVIKGELSSAVVSIGSCRNHLNGSLNFILSSSSDPIAWPDGRTTPSLPEIAAQRRATSFAFDNWLAVVGPKNMDPQLIHWLQERLMTAKSTAPVGGLIRALLHDPLNISPQEMSARIQDNAQRWGDYVNRLQLNQALNLDL